jgi:DNA-directed RNA polymerase specialized sigma24 family protein
MYNGLKSDVFGKVFGDVKKTVSDGYDVVTEVIIGLLEYGDGKKLSDIAYVKEDGEKVTVLKHAFRSANQYIFSYYRGHNKSVSIDDMQLELIVDEYVQYNDEYEKRLDYLIHRLELSKNERKVVVLACYNVNKCQIATSLDIERRNVYTYLSRAKSKFLKTFAGTTLESKLKRILNYKR